MPLIGTAGHVDHGKSTLVQRLTGRDPDRWKEEKERGLTIDLGFAWALLPSGIEVSFVDVPGHERYMKNMLAGIEAVDIALLVVAADEGWMPQTEEHVAVLDLLGVRDGVVALNKADTVDDDLMELAVLEISERLAGTSLEDAPIVSLSAVTGEGVDTLVAHLDALASSLEQQTGRPRLWIDRSFPISGAGTVVTGSLLGGKLDMDQIVEVYPSGLTGRIRGIQTHEKAVTSVEPGRRVAINLAGIDHDEIARGKMLGLPNQWDSTSRFSAQVESTRYVEELDTKGAYTIHVGSTAQRTTMTGRSGRSAVFQTDDPISLSSGDRFIIRDTGRKMVVGGGRVIDISPPSNREALAFAEQMPLDASPDEFAARLLAVRRSETIDALMRHSGGRPPDDAVVVGDMAVNAEYAESLVQAAIRLCSEAQLENPLRPGMSLATLAEKLDVGPAVVEAVIEASPLVRRGPVVATPEFSPTPSDSQMADWSAARERLGASLGVPKDTDLDVDGEMLAHLLRVGELTRISDDLVFLPSQIESLEEIGRNLDDGFTVADFRDATGLSRKYAVPILEWMDKEGLTVRRGETRSFR